MRNFIISCKRNHQSKLQQLIREEDKASGIAAFRAYISWLSGGFRNFYSTNWRFSSLLDSPEETLVDSDPSSRKVTPDSNPLPDPLARADMSGSPLGWLGWERLDIQTLFAEWTGKKRIWCKPWKSSSSQIDGGTDRTASTVVSP